jgi:hypothetical protein
MLASQLTLTGRQSVEALHPNQDLLSDFDLYLCISFVSVGMTIGETSFVSGIDDRQAPKFCRFAVIIG